MTEPPKSSGSIAGRSLRGEILVAAARPLEELLVWDQHGCLPLRYGATVDGLIEYAEAGVDFVSINVGFDARPWHDAFHVLAGFRRQILANPEFFVLAESVHDVELARRTGRLAVAFDIEGAEALDGDLALVEAFRGLGVRTMLIAYNQSNRAGGGCLQPEQGLTRFGREVVREMNRVGMIVDGTHCSVRTTMDLFALSEMPVILSHSVPMGVHAHERNVTDDQMRACADTGGVIGINGVGLFLGDQAASTQAMMRAVDHAVEIVGAGHVGLGLDHVVDRAELEELVSGNRETFPPESGYSSSMAIARPHQIEELIGLMRGAGYDEESVRGIAGKNFLRVASAAW